MGKEISHEPTRNIKNMIQEEKEAQRILEDVAAKGAYTAGHIVWVMNLITSGRRKLQRDIKELLDINESED